MPAVQSWGDVFALFAIGGMIVAGLAWGLKLEWKIEQMEKKRRRREEDFE